MPLPLFETSASLSLGIELELQLINLNDFDLTPASNKLLDLLKHKPFPGNITPEITQSMIEISTGIHTEYQPLLTQLLNIRNALVQAADHLNIGICGGGTHPFQRWYRQRIFDKPRYQRVSMLYGYLAKQFTVFGQHVHVGCTSGDEALFLLHALNRYTPHFIALSASSPFVQGKDTLFDSARLNTVSAFPLSGRAPFILRWQDFEQQYFLQMESTGIVNSMKDFYWDIRPSPKYGTIELRLCDTPLRVERAAALACYLQAICRYLLDGKEAYPNENDYLVYNYNHFQACRFGLDGVQVHPKTYQQYALRDDILKTIRLIQPYAKALNSIPALRHIHRIASHGNDAGFLRQVYNKRGSAQDMVVASLRRFRQ